MQLKDGRFISPETLVWEIADRGELARLKNRHFVAAYIECSNYYERVEHKVAAETSIATGCNRTIVALAFGMYRKPRIIQVHKANTEGIHANRGILAGCGYAMHVLKAMIKVEVKEEEKELSDFVDDMVLRREGPTETQAVLGMMYDLDRTKGRPTSIGQVLNDSKE
eukprot:14429405-Heterocapsa_arctica.AAC.1